MTGQKDLPTERILDYISNNPRPDKDFTQVGMQVVETASNTTGVQLINLSGELLKAMDDEFYNTLVVNTAWERQFKLIWKKKDELVIQVEDSPDGIYYIDDGSVKKYTFDALPSGTYYFVITTVDTEDRESLYSHEIIKAI